MIFLGYGKIESCIKRGPKLMELLSERYDPIQLSEIPIFMWVKIPIEQDARSSGGGLSGDISVSLANGIFYQVCNLLQVQFFHNVGPVMFRGADADG